jgi:hypothetical protein
MIKKIFSIWFCFLLVFLSCTRAEAGFNPLQGTVQNVSVNPSASSNIIFSLNIVNPTTTPVLSAVLSSAPGNSFLANTTSGSAVPAWNSVLPLLMGGTGAALTPSAGAIPYSTSSVLTLLAPNHQYQMLTLGTSNIPVWTHGLVGFQTLSSATTLTANSPSYNAIAGGSGGFATTLPSAASVPGKVFVFEQISGSGTCTLTPSGSDTFEGLSSIMLTTGVPAVYMSDGVGVWRNSGGGTTFNAIAPATATGGLIVGTGTNQYGNLALGNANTFPQSNGTTTVFGYGLVGLQNQTGTSITLTASSSSYQAITSGSTASTVTYPPAASVPGKVFIVEQVGGMGTLSIAPNSGDTIEGAGSVLCNTNTPYAYISDGTNTWRAVSSIGGGSTGLPSGLQNQILQCNGTSPASYVFGPTGTAAISGVTTLTTTSGYLIIITGGTYTITLPAASSNSGLTYDFIYNSGSGTVTIARAGSDTIMGATSVTLTTVGQEIQLSSHGTSSWAVNNATALTGTGLTVSYTGGVPTLGLSTSVVTSTGNFSPLFTAAISGNALAFTGSTFAANTVYANNTTASAAPGAKTLQTLFSTLATPVEIGDTTSALGNNASFTGVLEVDNGTLGDFGGFATGIQILEPLANVAAPTGITHGGTAGSTSYTYSVVAYLADGVTSTATANILSTSTGASTLTTTNKNIVAFTPVTGATSYGLVRFASSGTGNSASIGLVATGTGSPLTDTGVAATAGPFPTFNSTGTIAGPGLMLEQFRCSLVSGSPYADSTAASTIWLQPLPDVGNLVTRWNAVTSRFETIPITQVPFSISVSTAATVYDLYYDFVTDTFSTTAWTSATTPPTRSTDNAGRLCQSGTPESLLVCAFFADSTTTCTDNPGERGLANIYNKIEKPIQAINTAASWAVGATSWVASAGLTTAGTGSISFLFADARSHLSVTNYQQAQIGTTAGADGFIGIGLDWTTGSPTVFTDFSTSTAAQASLECSYVTSGSSIIGSHFLQRTEKVASAGCTYVGAVSGNGQGSGMYGMISNTHVPLIPSNIIQADFDKRDPGIPNVLEFSKKKNKRNHAA